MFSFVNLFGVLTNWLNREFLSDQQRINLQNKLISSGFNLDTIKLIRSITFGHNCICITKNINEDFMFNDRVYRFKEKSELSIRKLITNTIENIIPQRIKSRILSNPDNKRKIKQMLIKLRLLD